MEPISIGIGAAIAKWAVRLWVQDNDAVDISTDIIDLVRGHLPDFFEQRRAGRQFEQISDEVALRVRPLVDAELTGIPENERIAAGLAARHTLQLGLATSKLLVKTDMDPTEFESLLRQRDPSAVTRAGLSDAGSALYDILLNESTNYVMQIAEALPNFRSEATRELLSRNTEILELAYRILNGLPAPRVPESWGSGNEDERFINRYLKAVARRVDELRLFGVEQEAKQRYSLSVAYISLVALVSPDRKYKKSSVNSSTAVDAGDFDGGGTPAGEDRLLRVEAALGGYSRVLIAGEAGSGKTTLLQWIATTACDERFSGDLAAWNGSIPFLLPLRRYVGRALPSPEEFIETGYSSLMGLMPQGWVSRLLDDGSALVLIDGLDELPFSERESAMHWLTDLMDTYPESQYVVTSRPLAISREWSELPDFHYSELQPMQRNDIRAFISHWHAAARHATDSSEERDDLTIAERHMLSAINDRPAIRSLSETPLLCALICALHRDNANQLPQNRMDLYDTALRMLLLTRDQQRSVQAGPRLGLSYLEKRALLEDFALWLHESGASDAQESTFVTRVTNKLRTLPHVTHGGELVSSELLNRSGVLRRPTEDRVDFVHRTFLEYLAAAQLIEEDAVEKLIIHSHLDQWREVVIMASGHASSVQRERLILGIINRGKDEWSNRHRLFLLAVACRETARVLSAETLGLLAECLAEVLPPRNMTEAAAIASAGPLAIGQLKGFSGLATDTAACVRALTMIATDEAMDALKQFAGDTRKTVSRQIIRGWSQFDSESYAREVLARSPLEDGHLVLTDPENMPYLHLLPNLRSLFVDVPGRVDSLAELSNHPAITGMDLSHARQIISLREFGAFPYISTLWLRSCRNLASLDGAISIPELTWLNVEGCSRLADLSGLAELRSLQILNVQGCPITSLEMIQGIEIDDLRVGYSPSLMRIESPLQARQFSLALTSATEDISGLALSDRIERLHISGGGPQTLTDWHLSPRASWCELQYQKPSDRNIRLIGGSSLRQLNLYSWNTSRLPEGLDGLEKLRTLHFFGHDVSSGDLNTLKDLPELRSIMLHVRGGKYTPAIDGFERLDTKGRSAVAYKRESSGT